MNKKKIVTACLVVALLAVFAIGGSLAYFTDTDDAGNVFTVGNVDISLDEHKVIKDGYTWEATDEYVEATDDQIKGNTYENVYPGAMLPKDPTVTNQGKNDAWVRVNVTISSADAFIDAMSKHNITNLATIFAGHNESLWELAGRPVKDEDADTITYSYYYKTILKTADDPETTDVVENSTGALFTSVTIPAAFTSEEMAAIGEKFTINVTADAIQAQGFDNYVDAFAKF